MKNLKTHFTLAIFSTLSLVACGGSDEPAPVIDVPMNVRICQTISGCTTTANGGYQFPDGYGGMVVCTNGLCVNQNNGISYNYDAGYDAGNAAGQASGYSAGYNTGYNSTYQTGYTAGVNAPSTTAYNNGFNAGYNNGYNSSYNSGYNSGYNTSTGSAYNSGYSDGDWDGYFDGRWDGQQDGQSDGQYYGNQDGYHDGYNSGYDNGYNDGYSDGYYGYNVNGSTKDVDLQKANYQEKTLEDRAELIANQFQMSVEAATQLTQLSQKVQKMAMSGHMTAKDREAITKSALSIAGLTTEEVNDALKATMEGDKRATEDLLEKAARNLGMDSSADLRDKLLPSLGIKGF
jgi:flagellar biosynthesis/type III secretory pathway protein FliH